ncbi:MAG: hypothetical protein AAF960_16905 [Bacteroidota bacterium]
MSITKGQFLMLTANLLILVSCSPQLLNSNLGNKNTSHSNKPFLRIYKQDCNPKNLDDEVFVIVNNPPILQNSNEQDFLKVLNETTVLSHESSNITLVGSITINKEGNSCLSYLMGQFQYKLDYDQLADVVRILEWQPANQNGTIVYFKKKFMAKASSGKFTSIKF